MADARAGAPGINEPAIPIEIGEQHRPEKGPRRFRVGPADHDKFRRVEARMLRKIARQQLLGKQSKISDRPVTARPIENEHEIVART